MKGVLDEYGIRHESHKVFQVGTRSVVVDFFLPEGSTAIECWTSRSRRGTALTWAEIKAAYIDLKFRRLKENYPGTRCLGLVEVLQVDIASLEEVVGAVMLHADVMTYSIEEFLTWLLASAPKEE